jgi:hypothetical protein
MLDSLDLPRLCAALARLKEAHQKDAATIAKHAGAMACMSVPASVTQEVLGAECDLLAAVRDLPAADLLALAGEVERLREAVTIALRLCICGGFGQYRNVALGTVGLLGVHPCPRCAEARAALSAPAPDGEARP